MEHLEYRYKTAGGKLKYSRKSVIAGVVASGNLEVMMEVVALDGYCDFAIDTAAGGFADSWQAVVNDFMERNRPANLRISINDNAASPSVVSLRLDQALEAITEEETR